MENVSKVRQDLMELCDQIDDQILSRSDSLKLNTTEKNNFYELKRYMYNELVPRYNNSAPYLRFVMLDAEQQTELRKALEFYINEHVDTSAPDQKQRYHNEVIRSILEALPPRKV